jgi:hypothetical protein
MGEFSVSPFELLMRISRVNILDGKTHPPDPSKATELHGIVEIEKMGASEQVLPHPVPAERQIHVEFPW